MVKTYNGVMLLNISFKEHIKGKWKAAILDLLTIRAHRKYLTRKASAKLTISLVISHLDYANAIPAEQHKVSLDKLQEYKIWQQKQY